MDMLRVTLRWAGFIGGPGYSNFFFASDAGFWDGGILTPDAEVAAQGAALRVADATREISPYIPSDVTFSIEPGVDVLDSDTGEIQGLVDIDSEQMGIPNGDGGYSAASGAVVNWNTAQYRNGRRVRGRTFLVPLSGNAYESDGTLTDPALGSIRDFASEIIGDGSAPAFGVWSRPRAGAGGVFAPVTGSSVPDMSAVLRSRRD